MTPLAISDQRHAALSRALVKACNGLEEAAQSCRYSVSQLSRCQTHGTGCFLSADVIADLELYCGQAIYSQALVEARPTDHAGELFDDACEETEHAAELQVVARRVRAKGAPSKADCDQLRALLSQMETAVMRVRADIEHVGCAR